MTEKRDEIARKRAELMRANADINAVNKALSNLQKIAFANRVFTEEPTLELFYTALSEMENYRHVVYGTAGIGLGALLSRVLWDFQRYFLSICIIYCLYITHKRNGDLEL